MNRIVLAIPILMFAAAIVLASWPDHRRAVAFAAEPSTQPSADRADPLAADFDQFRKNLRALKANGMRLSNGMVYWQADQWMKEAAYYQKLSTADLADEVLAVLDIVGMTLSKYSMHEDSSLIELEELHPGFKELEGRLDFADGLLHVYETLGAKLDPNSDLKNVVRVSMMFMALPRLPDLPPFVDRMRGRDREFLKANLDAVDRYRDFISKFDPKKLGTNLPFYGEPASLARAAMLLAAKIDANRYARVAPDFEKAKPSNNPQRMEALKAYLDLVSDRLRPFLAPELL